MEVEFADRAPEPPTLAFQSPVAIGSKRERTPQGWLKIRDVVVARTGIQEYHGSEIPVEPGPHGFVVVGRTAEDLFSPEAMASYYEMPIVDEHPREPDGSMRLLTSATTLDHLLGVMTNFRQGEGDRADRLLADAILWSDAGIALVEAGKRQVSFGYTASYLRIEPGRGRQLNFRGNHVAIVHRGRCGAECAFGDQEHTPMPEQTPAPAASPVPRVPARPRIALGVAVTPAHRLAAHRLMAAVATGDEDYVAAEIAAAMPVEEVAPAADPLADIRASIAQLMESVTALKAWKESTEAAPAAAAEAAAAIAEVAEVAAEVAGEALPEELTTDAAWRDTVSRAEILAPGLAVPTGDNVATPKDRGAAIVTHQRRALNAAYDAHPDAIRPLFGTTGKPAFDKMPAIALRGFFIAASENAARARTAAAVRPAVPTGDSAAAKGPRTPAEINARAAEVWGAKR